MSTVSFVGLSGDKAVIASTNKIQYLKSVSQFVVKKIYEKTMGPSDFVNQSGEYELSLKFGCMCRSIKRFACFSSTLNCIIVKKGADTCSS